MAKKNYTFFDCEKDRRLVEAVQDSGFPINNIPDSLISKARELLACRYPRVKVDGGRASTLDVSDGRVRMVLHDTYYSAIKRIEDYEEGQGSTASQTPSELESDVERISGLEAEELGLCGCISYHRKNSKFYKSTKMGLSWDDHSGLVPPDLVSISAVKQACVPCCTVL